MSAAEDHLLSAIEAAFETHPEVEARLAMRLARHLALPMAQAVDAWIDSTTAADYLGLTKAALHRLTSSRSIPFEQDCQGGKCWFKRSELDDWRRAGGAGAWREGCTAAAISLPSNRLTSGRPSPVVKENPA